MRTSDDDSDFEPSGYDSDTVTGSSIMTGSVSSDLQYDEDDLPVSD